MAFETSCHCGKVRATVDEDMPTKGMSCNCSICRRNGNIHHFVTADKVTAHADLADIQIYEFNTRKIHHQFCKTCGSRPFSRGEGPNGPMVEINLRCVPDCDIEALEIQHYDGANKM